MTSSNSSSSMILLIQNLPEDVNHHEIESFLNGIQIINEGIKIISTPSNTTITNKKAFVKVQREHDVLRAIQDCDQKFLRPKFPVVRVSRTTKREMEKELGKFRSSFIKRNLEMTCEWSNCNEKFNDRTLYLSHINKTHVQTYDAYTKEKNKCHWQGCYEDSGFMNIGHFQLHLSFHAYHNQMMNIGQQIMNITTPKPICYNDNSTRNVVTDSSTILICGWKGCNAEFYDAETFFIHVDFHAIEDVDIPMMSREKLKKVRFAKCQWVNCQATFKKKSHLKMHLHSHTQKKYVACPVCGDLFTNRIGFLNHCYRQETPTNIVEPTILDTDTGFVDVNDDEDETEGILTIDEDPNQSSIVIHLPHNILPPQATAIINSNNELQLSSTSGHHHPDLHSQSSKTEPSNVALLVNFNPTANQTAQALSNNDDQDPTNGNNVIQLQLAPAPSNHRRSSNIVREHRCTQCSKSFNTVALLREHMAKHSKKYACPYCAYAAGYQSRLKEHILFRHNDNFEFKCTFCGQRFKNRRFLQRHIELHKSEKKINCQVCEQTFTSFYSLKRHFRLKHLKEQIVFACHLCPKEYNRGNNLSRHLIGTHRLRIADGWSRFTYEKQPGGQHQEGVYRINPLSCTI